MTRINIVMVGTTGHGKSSTGNTILRNYYFQEHDVTVYGTEILSMKKSFIDSNIELKVYDTPGLRSLRFLDKKYAKWVRQEFDELMSLTPKIEVFILVLNYMCRFTNEEKENIKELKSYFGESFLRDHGIVVITNGDKCEAEARIQGKDPDEFFKQWCSRNGPDFSDLLSEVGGNCILLNNNSDFSASSDRMKASRILCEKIKLVSKTKLPFTKSEYDALKQSCVLQ